MLSLAKMQMGTLCELRIAESFLRHVEEPKNLTTSMKETKEKRRQSET